MASHAPSQLPSVPVPHPRLNDQLQRVDGRAEIFTQGFGSANPGCTIMLDSIYAGQTQAVQRTFFMPDRASLIVHDTLTRATMHTQGRWQMMTHTEIDASAPHRTYDEPNPSLKIIAVEVDCAEGANAEIKVELVPLDTATSHNQTRMS